MTELVKEIFSNIRYATISTADESGNAWAAPVWYVTDDGHNLYWWSSLNSQHSKNIERDSGVYITIFDSTAPEGSGVGLYIRAKVREVQGDKLNEITRLYNSSTTQFKLSPHNTTGKAPTRLYQAIPESIQINDSLETDGFYYDVRRGAV